MIARRAVAAVLAIGGAGCVAAERNDVAHAQAAYEQCLADHAQSDRECAALRERLLSSQERYQENAQRAWGCVPEQEDCPKDR